MSQTYRCANGVVTMDSKVRRTRQSQLVEGVDPFNQKTFTIQTYMVTNLRLSPTGVPEAEIHFEDHKGPFYEWIPTKDLEIV